jgi:hypothetical protein
MSPELLNQLHGMLVAMSLRERRKAGDVGEQECRFGLP